MNRSLIKPGYLGPCSRHPAPDRPTWADLAREKHITELWLAHQLRPYSVRPRTPRIGDAVAKGYFEDDFKDAFRRHIPRSELDALRAESEPTPPTAAAAAQRAFRQAEARPVTATVTACNG
jgi:hypothetical protein